MTVRIKSDGTPKGTQIWIDGHTNIAPHVKSIWWSLDAKDDTATVLVELADAQVDISAPDFKLAALEKPTEETVRELIECKWDQDCHAEAVDGVLCRDHLDLISEARKRT